MRPKRYGVIVSPHVRERFMERFASEINGRDVTAWIYAEVSRALENGRKAKTKPAWAAIASRTSAVDGGRYVWDVDRQRCYVVCRMKDSHTIEPRKERFDETWIVRTVLPANDLEAANEDVAHAHRYKQEQSKSRQHRRGRQGKR